MSEQSQLEQLYGFLKENGFTGTQRNDREHDGVIFQQGKKRLNVHLPFLERQTKEQVEGIALSFMRECQNQE